MVLSLISYIITQFFAFQNIYFPVFPLNFEHRKAPQLQRLWELEVFEGPDEIARCFPAIALGHCRIRELQLEVLELVAKERAQIDGGLFFVVLIGFYLVVVG